MAVVNAVEVETRVSGIHVYKWTPVTEADTCAPLMLPHFADKTVQVTGTFGGATITMNGSLNPGASPTAFGIHKPDSVAMTFATAGGFAVLENVTQIWPSTAGGTGSSLTVWLLVETSARR